LGIGLKLKLDCIPCLIKQALRAARLAGASEEMQARIVKEAMEVLLDEPWNVTPPELAHVVYKLVRKITKVNDPFKEVKRRSNERALRLYPKARELVSSSKEPLLTAVKLSIAGNIIDFGALEDVSEDIEARVLEIIDRDLTLNDYLTLKRKVMSSSSLLFFADNSGEIVFDKLLIEIMEETRGKPFDRITIVVKGGPIINDATPDDVEYVSLTRLENLEVRTVSNGDPGSGPERSSPEVMGWIRSHDVVIAKGQGNYECLSEVEGIFFLLLAKCPVIAKDLGVSVGSLVLKYNVRRR